MAEQYSFTVDNNVVWNQDSVDSTLSDTINEGYVTAEEDTTRYLSVLDNTTDVSLENLNITLTNPKLEADDYTVSEELEQTEEQNVVVFSVEGSDELFGIQMVQDEEGNLQKYQFQFRQNEDGQLEAIPETITLVPNDEEEPTVGVQSQETQEFEGENESDRNLRIFVDEDHSEEHILPDHYTQEQIEESQGVYEEQDDRIEEIDVKPGIVQLQNIKQEFQQEFQEDFDEEQEEPEIHGFHESFTPIPETTEEQVIQQTDSDNGSVPEVQSNDNSLQNQDFEHVEVNPDMDTVQETVQNEQNNDSDEGEYQVVDGMHITGDIDQTATDPYDKTANILKQALKMNKGPQTPKLVKKDNKLYLYVVQHPEKENVETLSMEMSNLSTKPNKINPRSILKSSHHAMFQTKNDIESDNSQDERFNKRFAKCKEAVEAVLFHNFINKTTIPQAPVRKNRLPRKQKINPVERMDEEIVVQEMMVSSNGFVETVEGIDKENLCITEYVELSDSDDDYDPKRNYRKITKKRHRRRRVERIEITITDDEDEEEESDAESRTSVIELDDDSEEEGEEQEEESEPEEGASTNREKEDGGNTPPKRRRGRPPKNRETGESPAKKTKVDPDVDPPKKPEIPCPKCDKTFPSQNSLKTHLQHHNLQSSLKRALPEYKYKCDKCSTTFINSILLNKHMCSKLFNCPICKRKFPDLPGLNAHKRTHLKENMFKNTEVAKVSPKQKTPAPIFKAPKSTTNKCKICGRLCSSPEGLTAHMKSHKEVSCTTCSKSFPSQLLLERHLRESCVKSPRKKTPLASRLSIIGKVKCDACAMTFKSHQALFRHKVVVHKLATPDKKVLDGEEEGKGRRAYEGVPAAPRLQAIYSELNCQMDFDD